MTGNFTRTDHGIRHDDHDVSVGREGVDERGERRVAHLHLLKGRRHLGTAQLELLDDVADLLAAVKIALLLAVAL